MVMSYGSTFAGNEGAVAKLRWQQKQNERDYRNSIVNDSVVEVLRKDGRGSQQQGDHVGEATVVERNCCEQREGHELEPGVQVILARY